MTFALPEVSTDIAATLREIEQDNDRGPGQRKLPKHVRAAMLEGAQEIEELRALAQDVIRDIEAAVNLRISMMASESAHAEQQNRVKAMLAQLALRLRDHLA